MNIAFCYESVLPARGGCETYISDLARRHYLGKRRPLIVVNSDMVRRHFVRYYGVAADNVHVVRAAIDVNRFDEHDRPRRRLEWRQRWGIGPSDTVALFAAMNYRLKGLDPLLRAMRCLSN